MSIVINSNAAATLAANNLAASSGNLQRSLNRLSSGSKIVSPADDAAGLAVSVKFSAAAHRQSAARTNVGNTVSFLQTQDGALKVTGKVLDRISELKTLYTDPTKNSTDKANYDAEFTKLQAQLTAIGSETFNGKALFGTTSLSVGATEDGATAVTQAGVTLLSGPGTPITLNLTTTPQTFTPSGAGVLTVSAGELDFLGSSGTYLHNGESSTYDGAGNWTQPATEGRSTITSLFSASLGVLSGSNATATFTPNSTNTNSGNVAAASSLATLSLSTITDAIADVATHRATNGATQSRLGFADELLTVNQANLEAANSRITDVDVAAESTQLARYNILVQSGTAMLSQANQSAQAALRLIS